MANVYDKIKKVKKPRVQISYEVEDGGKSEKKELPFVVGVLGDFSGQPATPLKPFKQRKFINIEGSTFNNVLAKIEPGLNFKVKNTLKNDGSELDINLKFTSMDDFLPDRIAEQVEPLKKLLNVRTKLKELLGKADRSEDLEAALEKILNDNSQLKALSTDLGINPEDSSTKDVTPKPE
ncbi:VipA-like type VI secretion system contractile sheath small subunit protein (plasmid) [Candidatus Trichorickettsia mobilis]|uniref:type VI secretion system contractile sheath small subunit n=1 Tax=Candidatus Trichorickettsia mobilis TaxID=1346319 RepID=UPI002B25DDCE|nr:type VI secretion system contractile sheath small subunit [Candidatus Trichorickettsia mobilis]WPY01682.1 VipA-like type VI secretion system contractile sheath small subunit protein [Candidatus Trichorickettsia mobilis]